MKKFRLGRKRKKKFKKDLENKNYPRIIRKDKSLMKKLRKDILSGYGTLLQKYQIFYFDERLWVRAMSVVLGYPEYNLETGEWSFNPKLAKPLSSEKMVEWYTKHYPSDKIKIHYAKQNFNKWSDYD